MQSTLDATTDDHGPAWPGWRRSWLGGLLGALLVAVSGGVYKAFLQAAFAPVWALLVASLAIGCVGALTAVCIVAVRKRLASSFAVVNSLESLEAVENSSAKPLHLHVTTQDEDHLRRALAVGASRLIVIESFQFADTTDLSPFGKASSPVLELRGCSGLSMSVLSNLISSLPRGTHLSIASPDEVKDDDAYRRLQQLAAEAGVESTYGNSTETDSRNRIHAGQ
jgi:hypothetical protein